MPPRENHKVGTGQGYYLLGLQLRFAVAVAKNCLSGLDTAKGPIKGRLCAAFSIVSAISEYLRGK